MTESSILGAAAGLSRAGFADKATVCFDALCLTPVTPMALKAIKALKLEQVS